MSRVLTYINALRLFFSLWGTANWYQGVDHPNLWQWLYAWRLSPITSWKVASMIWLQQMKNSGKL